MNENVLDVLMYLFETYVDTEEEPEADHNELRDELARVTRIAPGRHIIGPSPVASRRYPWATNRSAPRSRTVSSR